MASQSRTQTEAPLGLFLKSSADTRASRQDLSGSGQGNSCDDQRRGKDNQSIEQKPMETSVTSEPSAGLEMFATREASRQRRRVTRSRAGCITCKIRRVKCDETKPHCLRCQRSGRTCDGYDPPKTWMFEPKQQEYDQRIRPRFRPLSTMQGDEQMMRAFQFFQEKTATHMALYNGRSFWNGFMLQVAQEQPAVQHIMTAVSTLHESLYIFKQFEPSIFFYTNYGKAIELLRPNTQPVEITLLACVLFASCEFLTCAVDKGLQHIRSGIKIIREQEALQPTNPFQVSTRQLIIDRIKPIFAFYAAKSISWNQSATFIVEPEWVASTMMEMPVVPYDLQDLHEACNSLDGIMKWAGFLEVDNLLSVDRPILPHILELLAQWREAYARFKAAHGARLQDHDDKKCITCLDSHSILLSIVLETRGMTRDSELPFDRFLPRFRTIVANVKPFVWPDLDHAIPCALRKTYFFLSLGLIPLLFMTATKCREHNLRHEALALLRDVGCVEGSWNSCLAYGIAYQVVKIEEAGLPYEPKLCIDVPESNRVRVVHATMASVTAPAGTGAAHAYSGLAEGQVEGRVSITFARAPYTGPDAPLEEQVLDNIPCFAMESHEVRFPLGKVFRNSGYSTFSRPFTANCPHMRRAMGEPVVVEDSEGSLGDGGEGENPDDNDDGNDNVGESASAAYIPSVEAPTEGYGMISY